MITPPHEILIFPEQYAQFGEDIVLKGILNIIGVPLSQVRYLDLGTAEPITGNNTYMFYKEGSKGVVVDPLPENCDNIRKIRPNDKLLCGAVTDKKSGKENFYINYHKNLSSLLEDKATDMQKMASTSKNAKVLKVNTFNINEILKENFSNGVDLISTDIEGYDLTILTAIDYTKFRPKIIITESPHALELLGSKGYLAIWTNSVNTIYLDKKILK